MIESVEEFIRLRTSPHLEDYHRASHDEALEAVWRDVIACRPDMREWVAHNKTVPLGILRVLAMDRDPRVRRMVARRRKLDGALFALLACDEDDMVRRFLARNPKCPHTVLGQLSGDRDGMVAQTAADRL